MIICHPSILYIKPPFFIKVLRCRFANHMCHRTLIILVLNFDVEVGITGHNFERGPSKDHSTKIWLQLVQWFPRRRLKCEMLTDGRRTKSDDNSSPWTIKISSPLFSIFSLAAILVRSREHRTQFWKVAIQGPFHQRLVVFGPVVSEEKIKM